MGEESAYNAGDAEDPGLTSGCGKIPWRRTWQPTLVFLPGESHRQRSLVGYSPWGHKRVGLNSATNTHICLHGVPKWR